MKKVMVVLLVLAMALGAASSNEEFKTHLKIALSVQDIYDVTQEVREVDNILTMFNSIAADLFEGKYCGKEHIFAFASSDPAAAIAMIEAVTEEIGDFTKLFDGQVEELNIGYFVSPKTTLGVPALAVIMVEEGGKYTLFTYCYLHDKQGTTF